LNISKQEKDESDVSKKREKKKVEKNKYHCIIYHTTTFFSGPVRVLASMLLKSMVKAQVSTCSFNSVSMSLLETCSSVQYLPPRKEVALGAMSSTDLLSIFLKSPGFSPERYFYFYKCAV
jgi:hypothetical protein